MRTFVVSDLYGDKEMYDIILSYLNDLEEDVLLILNGNMIGKDGSFDILMDVISRKSDNIQIEYLGGNLELNLYQRLSEGRLKNYLGDLKTYHLFPEGIFYRSFLVAHGDVPKDLLISSRIKDNDSHVFDIVGRRMDIFDRNYSTRQFMGAIGHHKYKNTSFFLIKGGVPIYNEDGFFYNCYEHSLTIDGGCNYYMMGDITCDHVPLVELENGMITILIFNHNGDIINCYKYDGKLYNSLDTAKVFSKELRNM